MKHPYADILQAIAEGKEIQRFLTYGKEWHDQGHDLVLRDIYDMAYAPEQYRIKPATIVINGVTCEAPLKASGSAAWIRLDTYETETMLHFATPEARDAAYAALILPFGEQA